MASISTDSGGNRMVQFIAADGKRRTIRLGKADLKTAREIARRVDALNVAAITRQAVSRDLAEWLAGIGEKLHKKLAKVGLVGSRSESGPMPTLGEFLKDFIAKREGSKESTLSSIRVATSRLTKYFGADAPLDSITPGQADDWLLWMQVTKKYAGATIGRTVKHAKRFFLSAVRLEQLAKSPFAHLRSRKQTNDARKYFVDQEVAGQVLEVLPDVEWRLIFALSRFGGLRCPSEVLELQWTDIDWEHNRFTVRAPKTGERVVPIFTELQPYLEEAFHAAPEGAVHVITRRRASAQRWGILLERILARAGITRWERIFHNLRASRQTELTERFSIGTVCRWLGNSVVVADAHYLTALESEFKRAAAPKALQNPVQQTETNGDEPLHARTGDLAETLEIARNVEKQPRACKSQGG